MAFGTARILAAEQPNIQFRISMELEEQILAHQIVNEPMRETIGRLLRLSMVDGVADWPELMPGGASVRNVLMSETMMQYAEAHQLPSERISSTVKRWLQAAVLQPKIQPIAEADTLLERLQEGFPQLTEGAVVPLVDVFESFRDGTPSPLLAEMLFELKKAKRVRLTQGKKGDRMIVIDPSASRNNRYLGLALIS